MVGKKPSNCGIRISGNATRGKLSIHLQARIAGVGIMKFGSVFRGNECVSCIRCSSCNHARSGRSGVRGTGRLVLMPVTKTFNILVIVLILVPWQSEAAMLQF